MDNFGAAFDISTKIKRITLHSESKAEDILGGLKSCKHLENVIFVRDEWAPGAARPWVEALLAYDNIQNSKFCSLVLWNFRTRLEFNGAQFSGKQGKRFNQKSEINNKT